MIRGTGRLHVMQHVKEIQECPPRPLFVLCWSYWLCVTGVVWGVRSGGGGCHMWFSQPLHLWMTLSIPIWDVSSVVSVVCVLFEWELRVVESKQWADNTLQEVYKYRPRCSLSHQSPDKSGAGGRENVEFDPLLMSAQECISWALSCWVHYRHTAQFPCEAPRSHESHQGPLLTEGDLSLSEIFKSISKMSQEV